MAWDPLAKYIASLSSDRTCRIYVNKPQSKGKGNEKMNYVCQHVIAKVEPQAVDESKVRISLLYLPCCGANPVDSIIRFRYGFHAVS